MEHLSKQPEKKLSSETTPNENANNSKLEDVLAWEKKDYYEVLGISKNATQENIKKGYRAISMKYHPDKAHDDVLLEKNYKEIFQIIGNAYTTLEDTEKRAKYDKENNPETKRLNDIHNQIINSFLKRYSKPFTADQNISDFFNDMIKNVKMNVGLGVPHEAFSKVVNEIVNDQFKNLMKNFTTPKWGEKMPDSFKKPESFIGKILIFLQEAQKLHPGIRNLLVGENEKKQVLEYFDMYIKNLPRIQRTMAAMDSRIWELVEHPTREELIKRAQDFN